MDEKGIGARIRRLRDRKAWTQEHLAQAAEVSVRTVQRAEEGVMSAETLQALASAFDEPVEALTADSSYPRVTPIVFYEDPGSIDWVTDAFGFGVRMKIPGPGGAIVHGELTCGNEMIMVAVPMDSHRTATPRQLEGRRTVSLYVRVDDVDAHIERVRAAGGKILSEPEEVHGQRRYAVEDPEGHMWWFFQDLQAGR